MPKTKAYALKSSLYFDGEPYMVGNPIELPDYMVKEWLALGLVSLEPPAPKVEAPVEKPKEPKKVNLGGALHKEHP
jgi:hypothetical protein